MLVRKQYIPGGGGTQRTVAACGTVPARPSHVPPFHSYLLSPAAAVASEHEDNAGYLSITRVGIHREEVHAAPDCVSPAARKTANGWPADAMQAFVQCFREGDKRADWSLPAGVFPSAAAFRHRPEATREEDAPDGGS